MTKKDDLGAVVAACQKGDKDAQERLILAIQDRVYYHCLKVLKHEQDALDATQDVLITVITSIGNLREPAALWTWVNTITANRCKRNFRGTTEWQIPEDEDGKSMLDDLENLDDQVVPEAALDNAETRRLVMGLIDALPPDQKLCVMYYYYDEMSVGQIAQAMNVPEGTVKSRLNYARKSIKAGAEKLEKEGAKLFGVSAVALVAWSLAGEASASAAPAVLAAVVLAGSSAAAVGASAAGASATAVAATVSKAGLGLGAKIALGVAGAAVAGTAAVGGYMATRPAAPPPTPEPTPTAVVAVAVETPRPPGSLVLAEPPEPEPAAEITPEPTPEPTPEATTELEPSAAPSPSLSPSPSPSPTPSPSPSVTPSPSPSPTPSPSPSPSPTPSPSPSPTPSPTPSPDAGSNAYFTQRYREDYADGSYKEVSVSGAESILCTARFNSPPEGFSGFVLQEVEGMNSYYGRYDPGEDTYQHELRVSLDTMKRSPQQDFRVRILLRDVETTHQDYGPANGFERAKVLVEPNGSSIQLKIVPNP